MRKQAYFNGTRIAVIALFGALSGVLYIFGFSMAFAFPSFLELNFSDIPALIGTFTLGPLSGTLVIVVKILIKLLFKPTTTAFVGELADLLIGLSFVIPAGLIYRYKRTFRGAILSMVVGSVASSAVAVLANFLILVPFYVEYFFHGNWNAIIGMMTPLFPSCTKENFYTFYLWVSVLPFNLMRCLIADIVSLTVYKHISRAINRMNEKLAPKRKEPDGTIKYRNVLCALGCAVVLLCLAAGAVVRYLFF